MQNILSQLQEIIRRHYGLKSELELKPTQSYQSINRELYSSIDKTLSVPLFDPHSRHTIAYYKIYDIASDDQSLFARLNDLVQITLQSYIDLLDQLEVSENLMQYLQMELQPHKIIRLQKETSKKVVRGTIQLGRHQLGPNSAPAALTPAHTEILLLSKSRKLLDNLAVHIHGLAQNQFFIRTDHMPESFLTRLNDLMGLEKTTLYIPRIYNLSSLQQKTLETYMLLEKNRSSSLLIVSGTRTPVPQLIEQAQVTESLLKHFHLFHLLSEGDASTSVGFDSLTQCAASILGMKTEADNNTELHLTKSYNLIPSLSDFFPTIH